MKKMLTKRRFVWVVGTVAGIMAVISFRAGLFQGVEYFLEDILVSQKVVSERIVILAIDSDSISKIGQWPWPREVFAQALNKLDKNKPSVVGVDIVFAETSRYGEADDLKLSKTLSEIGYPVIVPVEAMDLSLSGNGDASASKFVVTKDLFRNNENTTLACVNLVTDKDGVVRRVPLAIADSTGIFSATSIPTFSSAIANKVGGEKHIIARDNLERIVYSQKTGGVRRVPFWRLIQDDSVAESLAGKIVLIGVTSPDLHDENLVPTSKGIAMPGVEIQANILNMLINNYRLSEPSKNSMSMIILLSALIPILSFVLWRRSLWPLLVNVGVMFVYLVFVIILFENGVVLNLIHILLAWLLSNIFAYSLRYFLSERSRRELKFAFSKYVSKAVLDEILLDPSKIKLGGEERMTTVLFSDVRGFTTLSESMTPTELTEYLNRYLTLMTDIVLEERGVVDKYIGDAVMAFWGAPIEDKNHAFDALKATIKMQKVLKIFNEENEQLGKPKIAIGVGLNSGKVVAGNMGSTQRFDYTVMGDTVNLASRLESLNKMYGTGILISESVVAEIGKEKIESLGVLVRELDRVKVKGKTQGVSIFEIIFNPEKYSKDLILNHEKMLASYYRGAWSEAIQFADKVLQNKADDVPTLEIKHRVEGFMTDPSKDWNGVYELKSK